MLFVREGAQDKPKSAPVRNRNLSLATGQGFSIISLAFVNDLDIVAVRIEHPCRIIAGIVFEPRLRCTLALASGVQSRFVECIYLSMVFRYKSNMHRLGIWLSFLEPEKSSLAVAKTLQIGVPVLAFVICEVCDPEWLQGLGVKSD